MFLVMSGHCSCDPCVCRTIKARNQPEGKVQCSVDQLTSLEEVALRCLVSRKSSSSVRRAVVPCVVWRAKKEEQRVDVSERTARQLNAVSKLQAKSQNAVVDEEVGIRRRRRITTRRRSPAGAGSSRRAALTKVVCGWFLLTPEADDQKPRAGHARILLFTRPEPLSPLCNPSTMMFRLSTPPAVHQVGR